MEIMEIIYPVPNEKDLTTKKFTKDPFYGLLVYNMTRNGMNSFSMQFNSTVNSSLKFSFTMTTFQGNQKRAI